MPKDEKSAKIEIQRRVDMCLAQMLQGWIPYRIAQYVATMAKLREEGKVGPNTGYNADWDWGVKIRMVYEYCDKADAELMKIKNRKRATAYNMSLARWNEMLRKALSKDDFTNARLIQKEIDKLEGAHEFGAGKEKPETTKFKLSDGSEIEI